MVLAKRGLVAVRYLVLSGFFSTVSIATTLTTTLPAVAAEAGSADADAHRIVPIAETKIGAPLNGPKKSVGIKAIEQRASVPLTNEFTSLDEINQRRLRAREITLEPGDKVAVHKHQGRPGIAYILQGEIWEHREGENEPKLHKVGSVAFEKTGIVHWWHNRSDQPVKALVIDIVPLGTWKE